MLDDLFSLTSQQMEGFSETIRDEFGQSIVVDVFEPILQEIAGLQQLNESFQSEICKIDQLTEELRSIGNNYA